MALLLPHSPSRIIASPSTIYAFHTSSLSYFPQKSNQECSIFSSSPVSKTIAFPPSRKLLRRPELSYSLSKLSVDDYIVKKVSAKEVQDLLKSERNVPLIIEFHSTWCGPCIDMSHQLRPLGVMYEGKLTIVRVDFDNEQEFAEDMQVRGLPTLFFISPDPKKEAIRTEGLLKFQTMRDILEDEM